MICPVCKEEGKKSRVNIVSQYKPAGLTEAFYDEEGTYHCHKDDLIEKRCTCTNDHKMIYSVSLPCMTENCNYQYEEIRIKDY